jgi:glycosyltransferase involved in cell wall biosynthesis
MSVAATTKTGVSVVVLAFNEEQDLRTAVTSVMEAAAAADNVEVEIIIVNDGSTDGTAAVVNAIESEHAFVRGVHHPKNQGFGAAFRSGLATARNEWITFFPGDNIVSRSTLRELLKHTGQADLVCAFPVNTELRPRLRQILSSIFSFVYKNTFNINLRSIHTTPVYRVSQMRSLKLRCRGYSLPSEIMIKLLCRGCTFMEIPGYLNPAQNKSSALRIKNFREVIYNYFALIVEIFATHREEYSRKPERIIPAELRG